MNQKNPQSKKRNNVHKILSTKILTPPRKYTVSEWATEHRKLSGENSSETGSYRIERTPYIKGPADAFTDPLVKKIVVQKAAQTGFTVGLIENVIGYLVSQSPCPILCVLPTLDAAETFSKDRIGLMARDTKCLTELLGDNREKRTDQTILQKKFLGGSITFAGSNSPSSLASRAIKVCLFDEADRFAKSAGLEGSPIELARARQKTFWDRKEIMISTPTIAGISTIEAEFKASDQNYFWVPCPACEIYQRLEFGNREGAFGLHWAEGKPDEAYYQCAHCEYHLLNTDKPRALLLGEWRPSAPFTGSRGYHLSELYSPFVSFAETAQTYIATAKLPDRLMQFFNLSLGLAWEQQDRPDIEAESLTTRTENYTSSALPDDLVIITSGIDVQADRLEALAHGWGRDYESWGVDKKVFYGQTNQPEVWNELDKWLQGEYETVSGRRLKIAAACIDSGYNTQSVYNFVKSRFNRRIYATKGIAGEGRALVSRPSTNNSANVRLFSLAVDTAKDTLVSYLKLSDYGPGYVHFPNQEGFDERFFEQLSAERKVTVYSKGYPKQVWKKVKASNEALDCLVYAFCALHIIQADLNKLADKLEAMPANQPKSPQQSAQNQNNFMQKAQQQFLNRPKKNFATSWRR